MTASSRRVLVMQHAETEGPGRIEQALRREGIESVVARIDLGQSIPPRLNGFDGLVVMGGPQGVYEEDRFPFLRAERTLVENTLASDRPILGVCLGSQILAQALGARINPGEVFELGWRDVALSVEAKDDRVLQHLPDVIRPFHWHGDVYDLPPSAKPVGSSTVTPVQGFVWKERVYGLLFHLEITPEQVTAMIKAFPGDVRRGGMTPAALMAETADHVEALRELGFEVFRRWAALI